MVFFRLNRRKFTHPLHSGHFTWENNVDPKILVDFLFKWAQLHSTNRTGWEIRGADLPEWVFDHQTLLRIAVSNIGEYVTDPIFRPQRAGTIAGWHDSGEIYGDRNPYGNLELRPARQRRKLFKSLPSLTETAAQELKRLKDEEEESSMRILTQSLHPRIRDHYLRAWEEYRGGKSLESRFAHQVHALVDCVRATLYKALYPREEFRNFFPDARIKILDPVLLICVDLVEERYREIEQKSKETDPKPRS